MKITLLIFGIIVGIIGAMSCVYQTIEEYKIQRKETWYLMTTLILFSIGFLSITIFIIYKIYETISITP